MKEQEKKRQLKWSHQIKSHSSFVTIAKKVSESIGMSSYEQNKKQIKKNTW